MNRSFDHVLTATSDLTTDRRMERICQTLVQSGMSVIMIGRLKANSIELKEQSYQQYRLKCFFDRGPLFYLEFNIRLAIYLSTFKFEILTSIDLDTLLSAKILKCYKKFDWYLDSHEFFTEVPELSGKYLKKKIWSIVAQICIPHTKNRYTVGSKLAAELSNKYGHQFEVIKNVPPLKKLLDSKKPKVKDSPFIITYLGVLNEGRGITEMIIALDELKNCELWIIGEGDLSRDLRNQVEQSDSKERVKFYGVLQEEQFEKLLKESHLGLNLLAAYSKSYYYSMANKFFDYIHSEVPVLTMDFPEYRAIIDEYDCGVTISSLSVKDIVEVVERIQSIDMSEWKAKRENCIKAKNALNWDIESKRLIQLYG